MTFDLDLHFGQPSIFDLFHVYLFVYLFTYFLLLKMFSYSDTVTRHFSQSEC